MDCIWVKSSRKDVQDMGAVYIRVHTNEKDARYSLGLSISKMEWEKYRSAKFKTSETMGSLGMKYNIFAEVLERTKDALADGIDTKKVKQIVKAIIENTINDAEKKKLQPSIIQDIFFTDYIQAIVTEMERGGRLKQGTSKPVTVSYIKRMKATRSIIMRYEEDYGRRLTINDIDINFSRDFVVWSSEQELSPNYTNGNMKIVRVVMTDAYINGKTKNTDFRRRDFIPQAEVVDQVYLSPSMIEELRNLDVSTPQKIMKLVDEAGFDPKRKEEWLKRLTQRQCENVSATKDIFVVGCLTGQRLSDYSRINKDMFTKVKGNEYIHLFQVKTDKEVYIPLDYRVREIIKRRKGTLPHVWEGDFNDYCRLLAELLHWTWEAKIDLTHIGVKRGLRFCDMVSSHTARRTFTTNAYAAGVPLGSIMAITGHSSERKLRAYLKLQAEDKGIIAAKDFQGVIDL